MPMTVVLDTNVFVAAGFRTRSASARLVQALREGVIRMAWNRETRRETRAVLNRIPPLDWGIVAPLFTASDEFCGSTHPEDFAAVTDPEDRKFAALAAAADALLVSSDAHLLSARTRVPARIVTPSEALRLLLKGSPDT